MTDRSEPARYKTAYMHYSGIRRKDVVSKHPAWTVQQVSSELGRQWKALTSNELKPWVELAQFDKARFCTEAHLMHSAQNNKSFSTKRKKLPNQPRQPDTAYICFWKSRRPVVVAKNPSLDAQLVSKEVARQWRALSVLERQIWINLAAKDTIRFQEDTAHYHQKLGDVPELYKAPLKDPFAPKPAKSGFQLFVRYNRDNFPLLKVTINNFRSEMSKVWNKLSDSDKNEWYELAKQDKRRYDREMNSYEPPVYMDVDIQKTYERFRELQYMARGNSCAPRLPENAYSIFVSTQRQKLVALRPNLLNTQIMHELGVAWKALSTIERTVFQGKARDDAKRFRTEMETFLARQQIKERASQDSSTMRARKRKEYDQGETKYEQLQDMETEGCSGRKENHGPGYKLRKSGLPRRPKSAYNLMFMSKRTELLATNQISHNECSALCGRLWRRMSKEDREPYIFMAAEDKRRYNLELEALSIEASQESGT
ncbi:hypothetical protein CCR75_005353 [Bremia lactucae]|uniref:HMG box domain-containing protein n=1 Tax=Bremia lactucae TaxID=4779 RepID=A0A976FJD3_BRELC|nr:hypothetical protein CCR75_005353 [Bremia lactucae]